MILSFLRIKERRADTSGCVQYKTSTAVSRRIVGRIKEKALIHQEHGNWIGMRYSINMAVPFQNRWTSNAKKGTKGEYLPGLVYISWQVSAGAYSVVQKFYAVKENV